MTDLRSIDHCRTFIDCQMANAEAGRQVASAPVARPVITISRQIGSGGLPLADQLAVYLSKRQEDQSCPWAVFDKNLVEKFLQDHHLPHHLAQFMSEDRVSAIDDMMEELLGLHPASWTLVHQMTETILQLAELGNVILVGRGANIITARLPQAIHLRLIGSLHHRAERVAKERHLTQAEALKFIDKEDRGRSRYLRKYFGKDIDDPLLYHLTINTDSMSVNELAPWLGDFVLQKLQPVTA